MSHDAIVSSGHQQLRRGYRLLWVHQVSPEGGTGVRAVRRGLAGLAAAREGQAWGGEQGACWSGSSMGGAASRGMRD